MALIAIGSGIDAIAHSAGSSIDALKGLGTVLCGMLIPVSYVLWMRPGPFAKSKWTTPGLRLVTDLLIRHFWVIALLAMISWKFILRKE